MSKQPIPENSFSIDVQPLPSAPPPSYDDAMASAHIHSNAPFPAHTVPLITGNETQRSPIPPASGGHPPYPVQHVQIVPGTIATVRGHLPVGRQPLQTTCPGCQQHIKTKTRVKNRLSANVLCFLLCLTCVCIPCSCCPYFCCNERMKVQHFCPRCNAYLGVYLP